MGKISAYAPFAAVSLADLLVGVDVSDTTMAATGTDKKLTLAQLAAGMLGVQAVLPSGDTTGAADTTAIQAAISTCQSAGGGTVLLVPGTYYTSGLTITASDVILRGAGRGVTILQMKNAGNAAVIAVTGTGTVNVHIEDLTIEGNKANQTTAGYGISINTPYSTTDTQHRIANADVNSTFSDGINITGDTRVVRMLHVRVKQAGGSGYNMAGSDHQVISCIADAAAQHGFVIFAGDPMFVGCKAFFCDSLAGGYAGFRVEGTGCYFTACEAQNNLENGWVIIGSAANILLEGCEATSNGTSFAGAGSGVQVSSVSNVSVVGGLFTEIPGGKQVYGISLTGTTTNTRALGFTAFGNVTAPYNDASSGTNYLEVVSKAAATTAVTVANTASIASLGSLSVPALDVAKSARYVIKAPGTLSIASAATATTYICDLRWGGTAGTLITSLHSTATANSPLFPNTTALTAVPVLIEAEVTFVTTTTCIAWLRMTWQNSATAATAPAVAMVAITAPVTVTTSTAQTLTLDWTWGTASASNTITIASSSFDRVS